MKAVSFLLCVILNSKLRERGASRGVINIPSFWESENQEKEEKRRKKFRLGSGSKKEGSKTRMPMQKTIVTPDDKIKMGTEPHAYKRKRDEEIKFVENKKPSIISQVRYPNFASEDNKNFFYTNNSFSYVQKKISVS